MLLITRQQLIDCNALRLLKLFMTDVVNHDIKSHIEVFREAKSKKAISEETTAEVIRSSKKNLVETEKAVKKLKKYVRCNSFHPSNIKLNKPLTTN